MFQEATTPAEDQSPSTSCVWGENDLFQWQSFLQPIKFTENGNYPALDRGNVINTCKPEKGRSDRQCRRPKRTCRQHPSPKKIHSIPVRRRNVSAHCQQRPLRWQHTPPGHFIWLQSTVHWVTNVGGVSVTERVLYWNNRKASLRNLPSRDIEESSTMCTVCAVS